MRTLHTGLPAKAIQPVQAPLANALFRKVPAGLGRPGHVHLDPQEMDAMLSGGARWAVERGYGTREDLDRIEERGCMAGAMPAWLRLGACQATATG